MWLILFVAPWVVGFLLMGILLPGFLAWELPPSEKGHG